jgi:hypothetical protein
MMAHELERAAENDAADKAQLARQVIAQTESPEHHLIVVTEKSSDPNLTRPFETFTVDGTNGCYASPITCFATEAAALAAHVRLVRDLRET